MSYTREEYKVADDVVRYLLGTVGQCNCGIEDIARIVRRYKSKYPNSKVSVGEFAKIVLETPLL